MGTALLVHCASNTQIVSSWKSPDVKDLRLQKVLAVYRGKDAGMRRQVEDRLVRRIPHAVASYPLISDAEVRDSAPVRAQVREAGCDGALLADAKQVAPTKPFFLYFATGAMHAPHHGPKEWADRYKGQFDDGWDAYRQRAFQRQLEMGLLPRRAQLSRYDPDVQDWNGLSAEERRLDARMMEVFAGFLEHTDHHVGRLIGFLEQLGELDNTLIMLISDNGASAEGGPTGSVNENKFFNNVPDSLEQNLAALDELGSPKYFNHYPWGWAWAGNTPFRRWKRETYRGGVSDPFIVHWPAGIKAKGEIRSQYAHEIDMVPTVLDALGIAPPERIRGVTQSPIEGVSFAHRFGKAKAETRHRTQYFEMFAHRSLYHDGWRAACPFPGPSFSEAGASFGQLELTEDRLRELDAKGWELYHVADDAAETRNLAAEDRPRGSSR